MKTLSVLATLVAALALPVHAGSDHAHEIKPRHGGLVTEARHKQLELVVAPGALRLDLYDHGKPVAMQRVSGKLTVFAAGKTQNAPLVIVGDALEARGEFPSDPGVKIVALLKLDGKPLTARFAFK